MRFKLDENIGEIGKALLEADGHDVMTVAQQKLSGTPDEILFQIVNTEKRALITLDRDFGEVLRLSAGWHRRSGRAFDSRPDVQDRDSRPHV